jgi:tRNA (guanine-N7-)-methyltransferase
MSAAHLESTVTNPPSVPEAEKPTLVYRFPSILERLPLGSLFPVEQPIELELGSGDGSFLAKYAATHPDRNFVGVERLLGRLRKLDKKGLRAGLRNLRLVRIEAGYLLEYMIPPQSLAAVHVYFPDPWPKRKHRRFRLINEHFTVIAASALRADGIVYLRTDDADYFEQMIRVFGESKEFKSVETPEELSSVVTDFERNFNAQGVLTRRAAYQKV